MGLEQRDRAKYPVDKDIKMRHEGREGGGWERERERLTALLRNL